jgi:hypothetical protein
MQMITRPMPDRRRGQPLADRIGAQRRAHRLLLQVLHARRQRTRAQHQREIRSLLLEPAPVMRPWSSMRL